MLLLVCYLCSLCYLCYVDCVCRFLCCPRKSCKSVSILLLNFPHLFEGFEAFSKVVLRDQGLGRRPICWTSKEKGHHLHDHQDQTRWTSKVPQFQNVLPRKLEEISTKCLEMA